jgi:hypothetical protein
VHQDVDPSALPAMVKALGEVIGELLEQHG